MPVALGKSIPTSITVVETSTLILLFKNFSKIPTKVIISEYTNIAASFFNITEVNFINGVLDKVSISLRK